MNDQERIITSVGTLFRALSHLIRGDLSVISNDLTFLSTLVPEGEVERSKSRCASIISTLHSLQCVNKSEFKPVETSVHALFQSVLPHIQLPKEEDCVVVVDPELTRSVFSHLVSMFLNDGEEPLELQRVNQDVADNTYLVGRQLIESALPPESQTIDLISGTSKLLGESSVPKVALCELLLVTQGVECQLIFSQTTKNSVGLRFDFSRTRSTY